MMKWLLILAVVEFSFGATSSPVKVTASLQLLVQEQTPVLNQRAKRLVQKSAAEILSLYQGGPFNYFVYEEGNELALILHGPKELEPQFDVIQHTFLQSLMGKVRAKGRSSVFETDTADPLSAKLDVFYEPKLNQIARVKAQQVPLIDLIKVIQKKHGHFTYFLPYDLAFRTVSWNYDNKTNDNLSTLFKKLAQVAEIEVEDQNHDLFFFSEKPERKEFVIAPLPSIRFHSIRIEEPAQENLNPVFLELPLVPLSENSSVF